MRSTAQVLPAASEPHSFVYCWLDAETDEMRIEVRPVLAWSATVATYEPDDDPDVCVVPLWSEPVLNRDSLCSWTEAEGTNCEPLGIFPVSAIRMEELQLMAEEARPAIAMKVADADLRNHRLMEWHAAFPKGKGYWCTCGTYRRTEFSSRGYRCPQCKKNATTLAELVGKDLPPRTPQTAPAM